VSSAPYWVWDGGPPRLAFGSAEEMQARFRGIEAGFAKLPPERVLKSLAFVYATDEGLADALVLSTGQAPAGGYPAYEPGHWVRFRAAHANTGATTVTVDSGPVVSLVDAQGAALTAGSVGPDVESEAVYSEGGFRLLPAGASLPASVLRTFLSAISDATLAIDGTETATDEAPSRRSVSDAVSRALAQALATTTVTALEARVAVLEQTARALSVTVATQRSTSDGLSTRATELAARNARLATDYPAAIDRIAPLQWRSP